MNKSKKVDEYLKALDNPFVEEIKQVREIILQASDKMEEDIKWGALSYAYKDNMATFNPRAKKFVNLTFHKGALLNDNTGLLEGDQKEARVARFYNMDDIAHKKEKLIEVSESGSNPNIKF
jgi:hypothetical protein